MRYRARKMLAKQTPSLDELAAMTPEQRGPWFAKWSKYPTGEWTIRRATCDHVGCRGGAVFERGQLRTFVRNGERQYTLSAPEHCYVLVWNSTPEPDGSLKPYVLRVSGVAWAPLRYSWMFPVDVYGNRLSPMAVCDAIGETFGRASHAWNPQQET